MTEFKRTTQAVDDIEQLVQVVLDGGPGGTEEARRLGKLVGETQPVVEKLRKKAAETDLYGPSMKEKVFALAARWGPIEGLARDLLQQRGVEVATAGAGLAPPPPAPAARPMQLLPRATPPGGAPLRATSSAAAPWPSSASSSSAQPSSGGAALGGAAAPSGADRREAAAKAAEARLQGLSGGSAQASAPSRSPLAPASGDSEPAPMEVESPSALAAAGSAASAEEAARAAGPPVGTMADLLRLVHCVFLGHGFSPAEDSGSAAAAAAGPGPIRVRYVPEARAGGLPPSITASYVPIQRHLVIYAALDSPSSANAGAVSRATVQLGMAAASVQAKVDYLVLYPLIHHQCVPALASLPPEVCFSLVVGLALPGLAALGAASKGLARAVFEDDVLWWQVVSALPPTEPLGAAVARAMEGRHAGGALPAGLCRQLVKTEVERCRVEADEQRRRRAEAARLEEEMRQRMLREHGPQRGPFPGGFPGLGGRGIIGGDHDMFPGGGFADPFRGGGGFGGRRPFGGGGGFGGGFGGGGIM